MVYNLNGYQLNGPGGGPVASAIRGGFSDLPGVQAVSGEMGPNSVRGAWVGGTASIATTAQGTVTITPQGVGFRPEDIVLPDSVAPDVTVTSIKVMTREFIVSSTGVPGSVFAASAIRYPLNLDMCQAGQSIQITFTNNAAVTRTVPVMLAGTTLQA